MDFLFLRGQLAVFLLNVVIERSGIDLELVYNPVRGFLCPLVVFSFGSLAFAFGTASIHLKSVGESLIKTRAARRELFDEDLKPK